MNLEVSLIIPSHNPGANLNILLKSILSWSSYPCEILVIDSSSEEPHISQEFKEFLIKEKISFQIICRSNLYPGKARNIGIKESSYETIAFLDIMTIPSSNWLNDNYRMLYAKNHDGIWGSTSYEASTKLNKIIRASTFGDLPIRTLPGSLIKKTAFEYSGLFIESTRAGEDADWMHRTGLHPIAFQDSVTQLKYIGLKDIRFTVLLQKWFRNYFYSAQLPYLNPHKDVYFYFIAVFMILLAFNWNTLSYDESLRGWNTNSLAYLPNITKLSIFFFGSIYVAFRGIFIPFRKGVAFNYILLNLPFIIGVSLLLDIVKASAFLIARIYTLKKIKNFY
jgi:glycosyltransferase involved in cell wall biosynthesis